MNTENNKKNILDDSINSDTPVDIGLVTINPTYSLYGPRRDMDYYLTPRSQFYNKNLARMVNSGYIPTGEIAGWNTSKIKYNPEYHGSRSDFKQMKSDARYNKRQLKRAMKYAGSDQQSIADKQFYNKLGLDMAGIVAAPLAAEATGTLLGGVVKTVPTATNWLSNLSKTGIQNKFVKDILFGATTGMAGDQLVREFTPYNGVADGLVKQGAKLYYNLKHDTPTKANTAYNKFTSEEHPWLTFGAEFANPINWIAPASIATKTNLYRKFRNTDGMLDLNPVQEVANSVRNSDLMEVENLSPEYIKPLFEKYPKATTIKDVGHRIQYTRTADPETIRVGIGGNDKIVPIKNIHELSKVSAEFPWLGVDPKEGHIYLAGLVTDRGHRIDPITRRLPALPLTKNVADEFNSALEKLKKQIKWHGGVYLAPYLDQIKFEPGGETYWRWPIVGEDKGRIEFSPFRDIDGNLRLSADAYTKDAQIKGLGKSRPSVFVYKYHPSLLIEGMNPQETAGFKPGEYYGKLSTSYEFPIQSASILNISDNPNLLVDENGQINLAGWNNLKMNLAKKLGKSYEEIDRILKDGTDPLENHLLRSAYSAQTMPIPKGITRQQLVLGSLLHDVGRLKYMFGDDAVHANAGGTLLQGIPIEGLTEDVLSAINFHASREQLNAFSKKGIREGINYPLLHAVSAADVSRGLPYVSARDKYPYLFGYETSEPRIPFDLNENEQMRIVRNYLKQRGYDIDENLSIEDQWKQLESIVQRANTYVRGVTPESGGAEVIRDLGITDPDVQEHILATQPVKRYNGQRGTFDNDLFGKYLGLNKTDSGTIYVSNDPQFSADYGNLYFIRRGNQSDYLRLKDETPLQYMSRLMPIYLDNYSIENPHITPNTPIFNLEGLPKVTPEIKELYEHFGFTEADARFNTLGHSLKTPLEIKADYVSPGLHVTDLPGFRKNLTFVTAPGYAGAYVGPYYKPAFHVIKDKDVTLSTFKKHGGKLK